MGTAYHDQLDPESRTLLDEAGFQWLPDGLLYVNQALHKAVSFEVVQDHEPAWLERWIQHTLADDECSIRVGSAREREIRRRLGWDKYRLW